MMQQWSAAQRSAEQSNAAFTAQQTMAGTPLQHRVSEQRSAAMMWRSRPWQPSPARSMLTAAPGSARRQ
jgi:hypothetical protein